MSFEIVPVLDTSNLCEETRRLRYTLRYILSRIIVLYFSRSVYATFFLQIFHNIDIEFL